MKLMLKILKFLSILIITVTVSLFTASLLMQDKIADIIIEKINRTISVQLNINSFRLSFLKKFPKASLDLKNVLILSSPGPDPHSFPGIYSDTLLSANVLSVNFNISDILKKVYDIEQIDIKEGVVNLFSDSAGMVNYEITARKEGPAGRESEINLEKIYLSDIIANYYNSATNIAINSFVRNGNIRSRVSGKNIDFSADADIIIDTLMIGGLKIMEPLNTGLSVSLNRTDSGLFFKEGSLQIEDNDLGVSGYITPGKNTELDISGHNLEIKRIFEYLPDNYSSMLSDYETSGSLDVDGRISGELSRTAAPRIEMTFRLRDGNVLSGKTDLTVHDLSLTGSYSNGAGNMAEDVTLSVSNLKGKLGSSEYSGSFTVSGFANPYVDLSMSGNIIPGEIKEYFNIPFISSTGGNFDFELGIKNTINWKKKYSLQDIVEIRPDINLSFHSFDIGFHNDKILLNGINGNLSNSEILISNNLRLVYKEHNIRIDGEFRNFPEWFAGRPVQMTGKADIYFDRLDPRSLFPAKEKTDINTGIRELKLPDDIISDINFRIDTLDYGLLSSSDIEGSINYKPGLITFNTLHLKSLDGSISGNGFIVPNRDHSLVIRANLHINEIDVNKTFRAFNNFGQDFIRAENLAGILSGSLSLLLPTDSLRKPLMESLTAEGSFVLNDGALLNFGPVRQLSSFIELSELEDIRFETFENDFFINDNTITIPQMDIFSSAVDLSVNGEHRFDGNYEYHVKMLLSEILSRKRKKDNTVSEFGYVEDDGLGRTSLLLKIDKKGDESKVGYDVKAAGEEIRNNIKEEKQTLKNILNEEYGWYENDTFPRQETEERRRFSITWDEADINETEPETPDEKKENIFDRLFKR